MAVFALPPRMIGFYKRHLDYISEHAVYPDKRRYVNKQEGFHHFIDLDHYQCESFDSIPQSWNKAKEKYSVDSLNIHGTVPWQIERMLFLLTQAFTESNPEKVLYLSSEIGHYIADAQVPLHTTSNYNGQFTGQVGIHALWESRLPELYAESYNYFLGRARYIDKPNNKAWEMVRESYSEKDSVLLLEEKLNRLFPGDKKYSIENKGAKLIHAYSIEYCREYNKMLCRMVERRMASAILNVSSFWYTAWVNSGEPDLDRMEHKTVSDSLKPEIKEENGDHAE